MFWTEIVVLPSCRRCIPGLPPAAQSIDRTGTDLVEAEIPNTTSDTGSIPEQAMANPCADKNDRQRCARTFPRRRADGRRRTRCRTADEAPPRPLGRNCGRTCRGRPAGVSTSAASSGSTGTGQEESADTTPAGSTDVAQSGRRPRPRKRRPPPSRPGRRRRKSSCLRRPTRRRRRAPRRRRRRNGLAERVGE